MSAKSDAAEARAEAREAKAAAAVPVDPNAPPVQTREQQASTIKSRHQTEISEMEARHKEEIGEVSESPDAASLHHLADVRGRQEAEAASLARRHAQELSPFETVAHGELEKAKVAKLFEDLKPFADKHGFEIGAPLSFGRELEVHDPQSGAIITVARPHRRDIGQPEILMTPEQVVAAVLQSRHLKDAHVRAVA